MVSKPLVKLWIYIKLAVISFYIQNNNSWQVLALRNNYLQTAYECAGAND
jgi:hypothetical protein